MKALREAFERARLDPGEIDGAIAEAEAFLATNAGHPVATAYQGSLHAMKAGAAVLPWVKLRHANTASALLDDAHERRLDAGAAGHDYPADLEILLLRGVAYASFPAFLGRGADARASLEEAVAHPSFPAIPAHYRALGHAHLAQLHRSAGEEDAAPSVAVRG